MARCSIHARCFQAVPGSPKPAPAESTTPKHPCRAAPGLAAVAVAPLGISAQRNCLKELEHPRANCSYASLRSARISKHGFGPWPPTPLRGARVSLPLNLGVRGLGVRLRLTRMLQRPCVPPGKKIRASPSFSPGCTPGRSRGRGFAPPPLTPNPAGGLTSPPASPGRGLVAVLNRFRPRRPCVAVS